MAKTVRSDGTPSKRYPLLNVHVYFAKACRCRVAIPQASKLGKTVASDGTTSKQPSSFRHVPSLDGRTYNICVYIYIFIFRHNNHSPVIPVSYPMTPQAHAPVWSVMVWALHWVVKAAEL